MGFERTDSGKKGIYFDGHERPDVVQERAVFLQKLHDLETHHLPPPCPSDISPLDSLPPPVGNFVSSKSLVIICHDESTFQSNEDQRYSWLQEDQHVIKPKSRGSGRMVSDFIDEFTGYLRLSESEYEKAKISYPDITIEAREIIEYGENRDGYWTSEKFLNQVKKAVKIAEVLYPSDSFTLLWLFDQSSNHTAMAPDALMAHKMNVSSGGSQPKMRNTIFDGRIQQMVTEDGIAKGLKMVLEERNVDISKKNKKQMIEELEKHDDFVSEMPMIEDYIRSRGHNCMFFPKFHCELNPIERVWGQAEVYQGIL